MAVVGYPSAPTGSLLDSDKELTELKQLKKDFKSDIENASNTDEIETVYNNAIENL